MTTSTIPAPPPVRLFDIIDPYGHTWEARVEHDAVSSSGLADIRTVPWSYAAEWLSANGYHVRERQPTMRSAWR